MKLRSLAAAVVAGLFFAVGSASAQTAKPAAPAQPQIVKATADGHDVTSEKGKLSYALGYKTGVDLVELIAGGEAVDVKTVIKALQDAAAKKAPAVPGEQLVAAIDGMQKRMAAKAKAEYDKLAAENKNKSTAFLNQNKAKPGVKVTPSGVQYRVIEAGAGTKPVQASTVELEVLGPFPLGMRPQAQAGQPQPQALTPARVPGMKVSEIEMAAMREALLMMPTGAKWEITLPPEKAYGADPRSGYPPNVAVQFEVKLVSVK